MITLSATFEDIDETQNHITSVAINHSEIKGSVDIIEVLNKKAVGNNAFIYGASRWGGNDVYTKNVDYYIGKVGSDSNGDFATPYVINVYGNAIKCLIIRFDTYNKQYPRTIIVNGQSYDNDSTIFRVGNLNNTVVTIQIPNWSEPYYPLRIQGIYCSYIEANKKNLNSLRRTINERSDFSLPSFGIISNVGEVSVIDTDGDILFYIEQQLLWNKRVSIYLNNTDTNAHQKIGTYYIRDCKYDNNNRTLSLNLQDNLEEWQNINIPKLLLQATDWSAYQMYEYLKSVTPTTFSFAELDTYTSNLLNNINIEYPYLKADTLWNEWQKLCDLCGGYIYINNENQVVFIKETITQTRAITIPSKNIFDIQNDKILDNKITSVENEINFVNQEGNYSYYLSSSIDVYVDKELTVVPEQNPYDVKFGEYAGIRLVQFKYKFPLSSIALIAKLTISNFYITVNTNKKIYKNNNDYTGDDGSIIQLEYNEYLEYGEFDGFVNSYNINIKNNEVEIIAEIQSRASIGVIIEGKSFDIWYVQNFMFTIFIKDYYVFQPFATVFKNEDNNKSLFSLAGNELITDHTKINNEEIAEHLSNEIIENYKNGKELATLTCSIADYYYGDTEEKAITKDGTQNMSFRIANRVIPYIKGVNGKDIPMSRYKSGEAKNFQVVGIEIYEDGAIWQKPILQEI